MKACEISRILETDAWFSGLPEGLRKAIVEKSVLRDFPGDTLIFATGDPPTGQFAVIAGEVRLVSNTANGKHVLYSIFRPGMWFGHLSVLDREPRFQDAVSIGPTRLLCLGMSAFNAIVDAEPRYILNFAHLLCRHIRDVMDMLAEMKTSPLPARLAHALLDMDVARPQPGEARVTQEALAAMMGTSRQTINRVLREWETKDIVHIEYGRVIVRDRAVLSMMAQPREVSIS